MTADYIFAAQASGLVSLDRDWHGCAVTPVVLTATLVLTSVPQDAPSGALPETYSPPVVRPFEPPSNFGRVEAEGDGIADPRPRALVVPVVVEAYDRSYEHAPSRAENAYDRGVDNAEAAMDARMGPLDGLWRLLDAQGNPIAQIALTDRGGHRPVEGAWRKLDHRAPAVPVMEVARGTNTLTLQIGESVLELTTADSGWVGRLVEEGQSAPARMIR